MADTKKNLINRIVGLGEEKMTDLTNELLSNPKFAAAMGKTIQRAMETKGKFDKNVQVALNAVNIPTKADYDALAKKVNSINKGIGSLELRLDELIDQVNLLTEKAGKARKAAKAPAKKAAKKAAKKPAKKTAKKAPAKKAGKAKK